VSTPDVFAEDRSMRVGPNQVVVTGWVDVEQVQLACRARMAVGDVDRAFQRVLQRGECGGWPPPVGYWAEGRFVLTDGRHEYLACLMHGHARMFVAWVEGLKSMAPPTR
jgi:hypothetical protein